MTLTPHDVLVVEVPTGDRHSEECSLRELLSGEERQRADRFLQEADRRRFILSHAALRLSLAPLVGVAPERLSLEIGSHGKPRLPAGTPDIRFNLSHSGESAMLAIAWERDVGIDIEQERAIDVSPVARRFFSAAERAHLEALAPEYQTQAFFRIWTRKESFVKAIGAGLTFPLRAFDVSLDDQPANLLLRCTADGIHPNDWTITALDAGPGYAAALTIAGAPARVVRRTFA